MLSTAPGPRPLTVRPITDIDAWHAIAGEWDRLVRTTPACTPLQSFDFLWTWWDCMAGDRALWILVFHDDQACVAGIAPLQISRNRILGKHYRTVEFLGMTEDILVPTVLFPEYARTELRIAFIDYLSANRHLWDMIELDELAIGDPLLEDLKGLSQRCGLIHREESFHECPYLDLDAQTPAAYRAARPRKMLKNLRASERKLSSQGAVSIEIYSTATDIGEGYRQFLEIEKLSWKRQAEVGISSDARYEEFYGRLLDIFARRHSARVMVLKSANRAIAATMAISFERTYCSLQIVHDEKYSPFSPGTLLELAEMEDLLETGSARRYEFLGGALTNKLRWTDTMVSTRYVRARRRELRTRLLDLYEFRAKPVAKQVLRRMGVFKPQRQPAA